MAHIPVSFTCTLHCSKRGTSLESLVPHKSTTIDKTTSVCREHLGTNLGEIRDLLEFRLKKLIFRRRVGERQLLECVFLGTFTAGGIQNTTMTRSTRETSAVRDAADHRFLRKHPSNRLRDTNSWSNPLKKEKVDQRKLGAHTSESPTEFHVTSSASQLNSIHRAPKGTALLARRQLQMRDDQQ